MQVTIDEDLEPQAFRAAVMHELMQNQVADVTIQFDGSGDEGQIEEITCTKLDGSKGSLEFPSNITANSNSAGAKIWDSETRQYVTLATDRIRTMREVLDDWAYDLLQETGVDWVNNEGGYGKIVITPATDTIECTMNQRYIDVDVSVHEL